MVTHFFFVNFLAFIGKSLLKFKLLQSQQICPPLNLRDTFVIILLKMIWEPG